MSKSIMSGDVTTSHSSNDIVVDLGGRLRKHLRKIPFHTTVLNWKLSGSGDPEAVYQELVHRLSDLMETLRGEEDE